MNRILIAIDCQNDFIDGALRNEDAIKKVPKIVNYIKKFDGLVIFTQDTHTKDYLNTLEGKNLPIKHCLDGSEGWKINNRILSTALKKEDARTSFLKKKTFGAIRLPAKIRHEFGTNDSLEIYICGFCTDICVVSNALILRANFPNSKITVIKDCCAGTSNEAHEAALLTMKSCQIDIE